MSKMPFFVQLILSVCTHFSYENYIKNFVMILAFDRIFFQRVSMSFIFILNNYIIELNYGRCKQTMSSSPTAVRLNSFLIWILSADYLGILIYIVSNIGLKLYSVIAHCPSFIFKSFFTMIKQIYIDINSIGERVRYKLILFCL